MQGARAGAEVPVSSPMRPWLGHDSQLHIRVADFLRGYDEAPYLLTANVRFENRV